jgi:hypothetical protein
MAIHHYLNNRIMNNIFSAPVLLVLANLVNIGSCFGPNHSDNEGHQRLYVQMWNVGEVRRKSCALVVVETLIDDEWTTEFMYLGTYAVPVRFFWVRQRTASTSNVPPPSSPPALPTDMPLSMGIDVAQWYMYSTTVASWVVVVTGGGDDEYAAHAHCMR